MGSPKPFKYNAMKIGMLVICYNVEEYLMNTEFITSLHEAATEICFVNNASQDNTLTVLNEIKEETDVTIIDIKKDKGIDAAIKAGVRYLSNFKKLKYILYLQLYTLEDFEYFNAIFNQIKNEKLVIKDNSEEHTRKFLKNVFAAHEVLNRKAS